MGKGMEVGSLLLLLMGRPKSVLYELTVLQVGLCGLCFVCGFEGDGFSSGVRGAPGRSRQVRPHLRRRGEVLHRRLLFASSFVDLVPVRPSS